jgi:membrane fusion protein (multidrug efflux system)
VGETISPGQIILSIANLQSSWVVANIEETAYNRIRLGQNVDVRIDTYPGKVFSGKVIELGGVTQATGSMFPIEEDEYGNFSKVTQRLSVKIEVTDKDGLVLKPGMSVEVKIHTV